MNRIAFILVIIYLSLVVLMHNLASGQDAPKIGDVYDYPNCPRKIAVCSCISWSHDPVFHCTKEKIIAWKKYDSS